MVATGDTRGCQYALPCPRDGSGSLKTAREKRINIEVVAPNNNVEVVAPNAKEGGAPNNNALGMVLPPTTDSPFLADFPFPLLAKGSYNS